MGKSNENCDSAYTVVQIAKRTHSSLAEEIAKIAEQKAKEGLQVMNFSVSDLPNVKLATLFFVEARAVQTHFVCSTYYVLIDNLLPDIINRQIALPKKENLSLLTSSLSKGKKGTILYLLFC